MSVIPADCECMERGPRRFAEAPVGIDRTNGRFGEVAVRTCRACGRRWLHYLVEYEAFTASGRWYAGVLADGAEVTAEGAVALLQSLPWHAYGGSWWGTTGRRGTGAILVDL